MRKEISYSLFQGHKEKNEKMTDSINLSNNMNGANESIILCLHKDIIQEKVALKNNITNNKIYNVAQINPNKNVKMIPSLNNPNDLYSIPIDKLQKTKKVDDESVR